MFKLLLLVILLSLTIVNGWRDIRKNVKVYKIDLDSPRLNWYDQMIQENQKNIKVLVSQPEKNFSWFAKYLLKKVSELKWNSQYMKDLKQIAQISGIKYGSIIGLNILYEMRQGCTSVLFKKKDGDIILGRNTDYYYGEQLQEMEVMVEYYRNNIRIARCIMYPGMLGTASGQRDNQYAVGVNSRRGLNLIQSIYALYKGNIQSVLYDVLNTLQNTNSYQQAKHHFVNIPQISPAYIILAGKTDNEGCVIAKDYSSLQSLQELDNNSWLLVQCNNDYTSQYDNYKDDPRKYAINEKIKRIGQQYMTENRLLQFLQESPNFLESVEMKTIDSCISNVKKGVFEERVYKRIE